jgi:hypothetical protein
VKNVWYACRILLLALCLAPVLDSAFSAAFGDCTSLGKQAQEDDVRLVAAIDDYTKAVARISQTSDQTEKIAIGLATTKNFLELIDRSIASLGSAQAADCFGKQSEAWSQILDGQKKKRIEFQAEREIILSAAKSLNSEGAPKQVDRANWKAFLNPSIRAFASCLILKKRASLALGDKKPSPGDFALIIRGACNDEEFAVEGEAKKIAGWTAEDQKEIKEAHISLRSKKISEYTEAYYSAKK